jgi:hypothetical protein
MVDIGPEYLLEVAAIEDQQKVEAEKSRPRLRVCWVTQEPVGFLVQPASQTRRRRNPLSTVKKSHATMLAACACKNSRQLRPLRRGAGSNLARASSRRMLVGETLKPSFSSSPLIRR